MAASTFPRMRMRDHLADPSLDGFAPVTLPGVRALVRRGYESHADRLGVRGLPAATAQTVAGGRQPHPVVELPTGERVVVRRYRRGGLLRHLNPDRYFLGHRALEELRATERARGAGVRAPEVLAAVERREGLGYTAVLATRWIPDAVELFSWLPGRDARAVETTLREAGAQVGAMHAAGIAHPDLNLRNFLVAPDATGPTVFVLDFDRARVAPEPVAPSRRARDLLRLARSARKLRASIDARGWRALREGYGADWPLDDFPE